MLSTINHLCFSYGVHDIFSDLNFRIDDREHIGLIGPNGCGKTTFFKLLTGEVSPDSGQIAQKSDLTIGILTQEFKSRDEETVREIYTRVFAPLTAIEDEIHELENAIETADLDEQTRLIERMTELQDLFSDKGGFETESRIRGVIIGLGFSLSDLDKPFGDFSGGEKTRIALGAKLLEHPDLLLLDEPTNYLDFDALNWLENFLNGYSGAFIIISHDRYFLNRVCRRVCEVEQKKIISYSGNYDAYLEKKKQRLSAMDAAYEKQMKELARQEKIIRRLRDYDSLQSNRRAASREKVIAKTELLQHSEQGSNLHFTLTPKTVSGYEVLSVSDLSKSFPNPVNGESIPLFKDVSFDVHRGERIGIIGPNGIGKTTLFEILVKHQKADSGRVRYGVKVHPGYYAQEPDEALITPEQTLIDAIRDIDTHLSDGEIRNILAPFMFVGDAVFRKAGELSGGEKARLSVAQLMVSEANFLLMDEPTNHIDMATREILENALMQYEGTLLFISHDRYFLNRIATHIFELTPEGMRTFEGNFDDYSAWRQSLIRPVSQNEAPNITKTQRKQERKQQKATEAELRRQKRALSDLEQALEETDAAIADCEAQMCRPDFFDNPEQAQKISEEYRLLKEKSQAIMTEWEALALKLENEMI